MYLMFDACGISPSINQGAESMPGELAISVGTLIVLFNLRTSDVNSDGSRATVGWSILSMPSSQIVEFAISRDVPASLNSTHSRVKPQSTITRPLEVANFPRGWLSA